MVVTVHWPATTCRSACVASVTHDTLDSSARVRHSGWLKSKENDSGIYDWIYLMAFCTTESKYFAVVSHESCPVPWIYSGRTKITLFKPHFAVMAQLKRKVWNVPPLGGAEGSATHPVGNRGSRNLLCPIINGIYFAWLLIQPLTNLCPYLNIIPHSWHRSLSKIEWKASS